MWTVLATLALTAATIAVKVLTQNPLSEDPRYQSHSVHAAIDAMRGYHNFLMYRTLSSFDLTTRRLVILWIVMALPAVKWRSRPMLFGQVLLIVGLSPVCLIFPRGGYMAYIPLMGWALYLGCLFDNLTRELADMLFLIRSRAVFKTAAFLAVAVFIVNLHAERIARYAGSFHEHQRLMSKLVERLKAVHPTLPQGTSILLVDDPVGPGYEMMFLAELVYHDPNLLLDRTKNSPSPLAENDQTYYDIVMAGGEDFRDVRAVGDPRPPVEVHLRQEAGGGHAVEIPEFAGRAVDLLTNAGQVHTVLDHSGKSVIAPSRVRWVRPRGEEWMAASIQ